VAFVVSTADSFCLVKILLVISFSFASSGAFSTVTAFGLRCSCGKQIFGLPLWSAAGSWMVWLPMSYSPESSIFLPSFMQKKSPTVRTDGDFKYCLAGAIIARYNAKQPRIVV
jgi:hypothetical protein